MRRRLSESEAAEFGRRRAQSAAAVVFGVGKRAAFGGGRALAVPLKMRKGAAERRSVLPGGPRRAVRGGHKTERINFQRYFQSGKAMGDGRIQRAEACGKAVRCAAKERRQGDPVLRREFFCGAANEREFLRAVILIGCPAAHGADSLTLFVYFCMIRRE